MLPFHAHRSHPHLPEDEWRHRNRGFSRAFRPIRGTNSLLVARRLCLRLGFRGMRAGGLGWVCGGVGTCEIDGGLSDCKAMIVTMSLAFGLPWCVQL